MDISTKTVTTRVHTAVATVDALKGVAIGAVTKQLGLADSAIASTDATVGTDGSITVEVVELVPDAPKPDAPLASLVPPPGSPTVPVQPVI